MEQLSSTFFLIRTLYVGRFQLYESICSEQIVH